MELEVRRAERSDLPAVKEMYAALVARMDREGWSVWSDTYPRDVVGEDIEAGQFYLLLAGDALAGAFVLPECYGYLPCIQLCVCYDRLGQADKAAEYNEQAAFWKPDDEAVEANRLYFRSKGINCVITNT